MSILPPVRGRGAPANQASQRFGLPVREADGDWLDVQASIDDALPPLRTTVTVEHPRSILSRNTSPDLPFDQSVNAYRGCEHGCIYCYARPTHAWLDLSPGLDFESRLFAKPDAAKLLRATLRKPGYVPKVIALGTNTDPYQPIEADYRITRDILEVCLEARNPVAITTKSDRVLADMELLAEMARHDLVAVALSVTTLDGAIARTLEPRAATPRKRLAAINALAERGIPVHMNVSPVIPAITDHEIEAVVAAGAEAGALSASFIPVRLPHEVAPLFRAWLDAHFPDRAAKVMGIIQEMRGGRDNDPDFGTRMRGQGPWAELIRTRFRIALKRAGLNRHAWRLSVEGFRSPADGMQGELF
ncbi:PA0069 family radical SAM protein [Blastomonas sp.]|uniref:PA0069 family radical SAM protein n=1 Tax=Blastomonas sp. TaxID=1909299 RepID=UPI00262FF501|nr:PA0069 family radical SAM protein [Blastomonas sp.]MDM7956277.1 PA0069 family radical SAM protein [Blastomonas sp.]